MDSSMLIAYFVAVIFFYLINLLIAYGLAHNSEPMTSSIYLDSLVFMTGETIAFGLIKVVLMFT